MKGRSGKTSRNFKPSILVFCDGITEKEYLDHLKQDRYSGTRIVFKPGLGASNRFEDVLDEIKTLLEANELDQYTKIFYALDLDAIHRDGKYSGYQKTKDSLLKKKLAKGRLFFIESRPCFEFWFLLHYTKQDRLYYDYIELARDLSSYLEDYSKDRKYSEKVYSILKPNLELAISNSKSILEKPRVEGEEYSYTFVHQLIEKLDKSKN